MADGRRAGTNTINTDQYEYRVSYRRYIGNTVFEYWVLILLLSLSALYSLFHFTMM
jgi:hypothetical protein